MSERIKRDKYLRELIESKKAYELVRVEGDKVSFTRTRKIKLSDLLLKCLDSQGLTTEMELLRFEKKKGNKTVEYTKEAYLHQRRHLNPEFFRYINKEYLKMFYEEGNEDDIINTYKGYFILSADGSKIEVPNTPTNREYFGYQTNQGENPKARALITGLYDSLNKFYIDIKLGGYKERESELVKENIDKAIEIIGKERIIIVFDRNYPSIGFINYLEELGIKYVIRLQKKMYLKERKATGKDGWSYLEYTNNRISKYSEKEREKLREKKGINIRITEIELPKEREYLISNIEEEITKEDLKEIYNLRWKIEEGFNSLKNKLHIEEFSGKLPIIIYQDVYASMFVYNKVHDYIKMAEEELDDDGNKKYEYKINENQAIGMYKEEFIQIIMIEAEEERAKKLEEFLEKIRKNLVPIRKGRKSNPRNFNRTNKYSSNIKRSY